MTQLPSPIPAPELEGGVWLNSEPVTLASRRGRPLLIDFWGGARPFCPPPFKLRDTEGGGVLASNSPFEHIDPQDALRALGYPEVSDVAPVLGGWDTAIWRFVTADGSRHVLRVFRGPEWADGAAREKA